MVTFQNVSAYLEEHEPEKGASRRFQDFFEAVRQGKFVLEGLPIDASPAELFLCETPQLTHAFHYQLVKTDPIVFQSSFACFDGQPLELQDFQLLLNMVQAHLGDYPEDIDGPTIDFKEVLEKHGQIEGAFLLCQDPEEENDNIGLIVASTPILSERANRILLYYSIKFGLYYGFYR